MADAQNGEAKNSAGKGGKDGKGGKGGKGKAKTNSSASTVSPQPEPAQAAAPKASKVEPGTAVSPPAVAGGTLPQATMAANDGARKSADPDDRPQLSNVLLITAALTCEEAKSKGHKLTLHEVYDWISRRWAWFKRNGRHNGRDWQSSIRHCIGSSREFEKIPRRDDEPGKGIFYAMFNSPPAVEMRRERSLKAAEENRVPTPAQPAHIRVDAASPSPMASASGAQQAPASGPAPTPRPAQRPPAQAGSPQPAVSPQAIRPPLPGPAQGPSAQAPIKLPPATMNRQYAAAQLKLPPARATPIHMRQPAMTPRPPGGIPIRPGYSAMMRPGNAPLQPHPSIAAAAAAGQASALPPSTIPPASMSLRPPMPMPRLAPPVPRPPQPVATSAPAPYPQPGAMAPPHSTPSPTPSAPGRIQIIIAEAPPHAVPAQKAPPAPGSIESLLDAPPIVHHEGKLYLNPQVFSKITYLEVQRIETLGVQAALKELQGYLVTYLKERLKERNAAKKRASAKSASPTPPAGLAGSPTRPARSPQPLQSSTQPFSPSPAPAAASSPRPGPSTQPVRPPPPVHDASTSAALSALPKALASHPEAGSLIALLKKQQAEGTASIELSKLTPGQIELLKLANTLSAKAKAEAAEAAKKNNGGSQSQSPAAVPASVGSPSVPAQMTTGAAASPPQVQLPAKSASPAPPTGAPGG